MRLIILATLLAAAPAAADIEVRFIEGAPKDRFVFTHAGNCATGPLALTVDLSGSPAGLVFDVTGEGAGVEVFQPFELVSGGGRVAEIPEVVDGDTMLKLGMSDFAPGEEVAFTIDLDDTGGGREITVSRSEIAGAAVLAEFGGQTAIGTFGDGAMASITLDDCTS